MCIYFVLETPNETLVNKSDSMQVIRTKIYPGKTPMGKNKKKDLTKLEYTAKLTCNQETGRGTFTEASCNSGLMRGSYDMIQYL